MNTLQSMWESYVKVLPPGLPTDSIQYRETRRAFYAGAMRLLVLMTNDVTELSDEAGVAILNNLVQEASDFTTRIMRGEV